MAGHPPSGTVTFLLTDLEGSTRLWEQDPEAAKPPQAAVDIRQSGTTPVTPDANFILAALREAGDVIDAALGEERRRELCTEGAAMTLDEAVSYALSNIDPKLLTGPVASIDR